MICEDTRVSRNLISLLNSRYNLEIAPSEFYPLHTHNAEDFFKKFNKEKFLNEICVFVSDAGMPCISDPGVDLIKFAQENSIDYEVIPGPNAAILAAAASGIIEKEFTFLGFLPNTGKDRKIAIQNALNSNYPTIIYESPKRIFSLIENIAKLDSQRKVFLIKEATKKFETKFIDLASNLVEILKNSNLNGEWCVVLDKSPNSNFETITKDEILALNIPPKQKAKLLSKITGENSKKIYENLIQIS